MSDRFGEAIDRVLLGAAAFGLRRPRLVMVGTGALLAVLTVSFLGMRFHSEVTDLVPASAAEAMGIMDGVFGAGESAFILIRAQAPCSGEALARLAGAVAGRLRQEP